MHRTLLAVTLVLLASAGQAVAQTGLRAGQTVRIRLHLVRRRRRSDRDAAYQRMKLSARGGRLIGKESFLIAAAAGRSLCAFR